MKIGYPCINTTIGCTTNSTFRLASYSEELLKKKIESNLNCLEKILQFNAENKLLFFRISSDLIPFASHEVCKLDWKKKYASTLKKMGDFIKEKKMRISMHPDQFVLLNSPSEKILKNSVAELEYHADLLDSMNLDLTAKIQIHVGGVYGDKTTAIQRFISNYEKVPIKIKQRLVIENDDRLYNVKDCLEISKKTGIPVLFDVFHHSCLNNNETPRNALIACSNTWKKKDGVIMVDYSEQELNERKGKHSKHASISNFNKFLKESKGIDFDVMLEVKDKQESALKCFELL